MPFTGWERLERVTLAVGTWAGGSPRPSWGAIAHLRYSGIQDIQLSRPLTSLRNSKKWAFPVRVKNFCRCAAEISTFLRCVLIIWCFPSFERLLKNSACCCMTCCCILLSGIQCDIRRQVPADSWEGDRTNINPGYLISWSSCNLFLRLFLVCLWCKKENTQKGFG